MPASRCSPLSAEARAALRVLLLTGSLLAACGDDPAATDSGAVDASSGDGRIADAARPADAAMPDCAQEIECPMAVGSEAVICGRLIDAATSAPLEGALDELRVETHEVSQYIESPFPSFPLGEAVTVDTCGRFALSYPAPFDGTAMLVVRDTGAMPRFAETARFVYAMGGVTYEGVSAYALDMVDDRAWTDAAFGVEEPTTIVQRGATLGIYRDCDGDPVSGLKLPVDEAYYFSDVNPDERKVIGVGDSTGVNGSALLVGGDGLFPVSPDGSPIEACTWGGVPWPPADKLLVFVLEPIGVSEPMCPSCP